MAKMLPILIVIIAVFAIVEAESYECKLKRHKANRNPRDNYLDYQSEKLNRENGIEKEKEPSDEECEKERELDRQTSYQTPKRLSISETFYGLFIILVLVGPVVFLILFVANKYGSVGARPNTHPELTWESVHRMQRSNTDFMEHIAMLKRQQEERDRIYKFTQNGLSHRA
ncbi:Hypothetical predicted protein [Mytilus galloprovincialis]|uniref:Transmembrane protein n=1 Tax=Mytilus galloprovincialis TaxID=29158 RepID=A0A8B6H1Q5_MYTGA|nr:Hypothetical predicted protein [Mytilus galloprovincialis]